MFTALNLSTKNDWRRRPSLQWSSYKFPWVKLERISMQHCSFMAEQQKEKGTVVVIWDLAYSFPEGMLWIYSPQSSFWVIKAMANVKHCASSEMNYPHCESWILWGRLKACESQMNADKLDEKSARHLWLGRRFVFQQDNDFKYKPQAQGMA